jgi:hypothetical protein
MVFACASLYKKKMRKIPALISMAPHFAFKREWRIVDFTFVCTQRIKKSAG